jgi:hypothetical protein
MTIDDIMMLRCSISSKKEISRAISLSIGLLISNKESCCGEADDILVQILNAINARELKFNSIISKIDEWILLVPILENPYLTPDSLDHYVTTSGSDYYQQPV